MKKFFSLLFIAFVFLPLFALYALPINADERCEILAPSSVTYGEEIKITTVAPDNDKDFDGNKTTLTIRGVNNSYRNTFKGENAPVNLAGGNWGGGGRNVEISINDDKISPNKDALGSPVPDSYIVSAEVKYLKRVRSAGWGALNPLKIFDTITDLVIGESVWRTTTCGGTDDNIFTVLPGTKDFTPNPRSQIPNTEARAIIEGFVVDPQNPNSPPRPVDAKNIDGSTSFVKVRFYGLNPHGDYVACLATDYQKDCVDKGEFFNKIEEPLDPNDAGYLGFFGSISDDSTKKGSGLCGKGKNGLQYSEEVGNGRDCDPRKDYFHEGHAYSISLFTTNYESGPIVVARFFVNYHLPKVFVAATGKQGGDFEAELVTTDYNLPIKNPVSLTIKSPVLIGGNKRNNYQLFIESTKGIKNDDYCKDLNGNAGSVGLETFNINLGTLTKSDTDLALPIGEYNISINEQVNEDNARVFKTDECQGGFTYVTFPILVSRNKDSGEITTTIDMSKIKFDPDNVNSGTDQDLVSVASPPCDVANIDPDTGECKKIKTAFGAISTNPTEFIQDLFAWGLYIVSFVAVLYSIYAGYLLISSRGDKEKVAHAREVITSTIIGIIFIAFAFVILAIIGADIIRIPGFSRGN